jgi:V/A-type H+/Na+-transporting ATPase subunit E
MALDKVVESIRAEGRRAADARLQEARKEADAIRADAEKQAAAIKAKREKDLAGAVEGLKLREVAAAELEAKKLRLNAEKDVLATVRETVLHQLAELPADKRVAHSRTLVERANMPEGQVYVSENDADAAKKAGLDVAGTVPAMGGVVVVSPDGSTREDFTYETLMNEVWMVSLNEVAQDLFGKRRG